MESFLKQEDSQIENEAAFQEIPSEFSQQIEEFYQNAEDQLELPEMGYMIRFADGQLDDASMHAMHNFNQSHQQKMIAIDYDSGRERQVFRIRLDLKAYEEVKSEDNGFVKKDGKISSFYSKRV